MTQRLRQLALVLSCLVLVGLIAATSSVAASRAERQRQVEKQVVCPSCGRALDRSQGPAAERMREIIREGLEEGQSNDEIVATLVAEYGGEERVLTDPPRSGRDGMIVWGVPIALVVVGALIVGASVRRWRRAAEADR